MTSSPEQSETATPDTSPIEPVASESALPESDVPESAVSEAAGSEQVAAEPATPESATSAVTQAESTASVAKPGAASESTAGGEASGRTPAASADCSALLKKTFPSLFAGGPKPLKLRIQTDIQERAPGVFSKQALSAFFRRYTGSTSYLIAISRAKHRFDLDGAPAGELTEEHRKIALDELARRRGNQESRVALEVQQRRNRATLLHDFERTTLTPANFCALKGIAVDELDGYLSTARQEAGERPPMPPAFDPSRRPPPRHRERPAAQPDSRAPPRRR